MTNWVKRDDNGLYIPKDAIFHAVVALVDRDGFSVYHENVIYGPDEQFVTLGVGEIVKTEDVVAYFAYEPYRPKPILQKMVQYDPEKSMRDNLALMHKGQWLVGFFLDGFPAVIEFGPHGFLYRLKTATSERVSKPSESSKSAKEFAQRVLCLEVSV